ncbi:MAG: prolyl-tRNA synthetase associated domain-containing protein [Clostridiales Family XIII bacterium]|jgi:Ala-tRNA(Pro) deacylase|nr:prolyl-tRNA synthetase associated domain-containing protein [Clostridiales Family XIII bacterium]
MKELEAVTIMRTENLDRRERVLAALDGLGIGYKLVEHPAVFSAKDNDDSIAMERAAGGAVIFKNLFLRNKDKSRYYLYSLPIDKRADLPGLAKLLGEKKLGFGSAEALWDKLHITAGTVSLLNVVDAVGTEVTVLIDRDIYKSEGFGIHPNDNTATVVLLPEDIVRVLEWAGVEYRFVELGCGG